MWDDLILKCISLHCLFIMVMTHEIVEITIASTRIDKNSRLRHELILNCLNYHKQNLCEHSIFG